MYYRPSRHSGIIPAIQKASAENVRTQSPTAQYQINQRRYNAYVLEHVGIMSIEDRLILSTNYQLK